MTGSTTASRSVGGYQAGVEGQCWVTPDGSGSVTIPNCFGGRFQASAHGTGSAIRVSSLYGLVAASPETKGDGVTIDGGGGLLVEDQKGYGDAGSQGAVFVVPQTGGGGTGTKGNIVMAGGGYDDGHINLDNGHLWYDKTNKQFRVKDGAPSSGTDGAPVVAGTGSDSHGLLKWGDGSDPSMTTGDSVCQASGLICVRVMTPVGIPAECTQTQAPTFFYALCK